MFLTFLKLLLMLCCNFLGSSSRLPLSVLAVDEPLEDTDNLFQTHEVGTHLESDLLAVVTELGIKVLAVGRGTHGSAEDGLDDEAVVGLQGRGIGGAERVGKLLRLLSNVGAETDLSKLKATIVT